DNFKAEDSPAAQASALKLTPHPILLSLSIRLLQVTVAISPSAAKGCIKGERFSARIRSEGPRRQMQDFESWMKGELQRRTRKFFQPKSAADFRESSPLILL
ncbi:MAG TPA: hypothetical protein H9981_04225, partial [Candidatus Mediterraneibacter caccavium]|nr:hypothetical protein [Candidatus Mediterraneibacter caccavium]